MSGTSTLPITDISTIHSLPDVSWVPLSSRASTKESERERESRHSDIERERGTYCSFHSFSLLLLIDTFSNSRKKEVVLGSLRTPLQKVSLFPSVYFLEHNRRRRVFPPSCLECQVQLTSEPLTFIFVLLLLTVVVIFTDSQKF